MRKKAYFPREAGAPAPIAYSLQHRVRFGEVDAMAVMWHGHYAVLFEEASTELRRKCGLTYEVFNEEGLRAPVVQFHVDYHLPLLLDEQVTVTAALIWTEAARLNMEYTIHRDDGTILATGYSVQLFASPDGTACFITPPMLQRCRDRWVRGEIA